MFPTNLEWWFTRLKIRVGKASATMPAPHPESKRICGFDPQPHRSKSVQGSHRIQKLRPWAFSLARAMLLGRSFQDTSPAGCSQTLPCGAAGRWSSVLGPPSSCSCCLIGTPSIHLSDCCRPPASSLPGTSFCRAQLKLEGWHTCKPGTWEAETGGL